MHGYVMRIALFRMLCVSSTVQTVICSQISVIWHKYFVGRYVLKALLSAFAKAAFGTVQSRTTMFT